MVRMGNASHNSLIQLDNWEEGDKICNKDTCEYSISAL